MHEGFDVEDVRRVVLEVLFESLARRWKVLVHEDLDEEPEVLVPVEADPGEAVVEDEAGSHGFFRKILRIDPVVLETIKVESALLELDNRHFSLALRLNVPIKVKLPRRDWLRQLSILVTERDAELDDL